MRRVLSLLLPLLGAGCGSVDDSVPTPDVPVSATDAPVTDAPVADVLVVTDAGASPDRVAPQDAPRTDAIAADVVSPPTDAPVAREDVPPTVQVNAWLEVHAADLWAQPLPEGGYTLTVTRDGAPVSAESSGSPGVQRFALTTAATYAVSLSAPDHRALRVSVRYDGTDRAAGAALDRGMGNAAQGITLGHVSRDVGGRASMVHGLWLGLRHQWFSAQGRPARRGNDLRLLMDGEEAYNAVIADARAAQQTIHAATWWWESDFELTRDPATHVTSTIDARRRNTVLAVFEASRAVKRVMVGQFLSMDGTLSTLSSDAPLRNHGSTAGDRFEYMGQANPSDGMLRWEVPAFNFVDRVREMDPAGAGGVTFEREPAIASEIAPRNVDLTHWPIVVDLNHASYHQKFMVIDDRVSFIGGMNLRRVDWDTSLHRVFEPRRMLLDSSTTNRMAVAAHTRMPDTGPRKDYMVRIEGPLTRDAQDVFHRRWRYLLDTRARYSDDASDYPVPAPSAPRAGGVQAQVTATLPAPFHEYAIAETWFNAVAQAQSYIYIEDQYFRIPMLADAIVARMNAVPSLRLVVITKPINEWTDPGCAWTYQTHAMFASRFPTRYRMLQLRSFDTEVTWGFDETESRFVDMDTHAKMLIVDDVFLSVGSCNKNNRGVLYEGELNVAVYDRAWVSAARRRILANILQRTDVPDTLDGWWSALDAQRAWNDQVRQRWSDAGDDISLDGAPLPDMYRPRGFVYTLTPGPSRDCLIEDVGPDVV